MGKLEMAQKARAVDMALRGESPIAYLKECGCANPSSSWCAIKMGLKKTNPETYAALPKDFRKKAEQPAQAPVVKLSGPLKIETPEAAKVEVVETPEKMKTGFGSLPVCAVRSRVRQNYRYIVLSESGQMYLSSDGGMHLQFTKAEWKLFSREILTALDQLGVEA